MKISTTSSVTKPPPPFPPLHLSHVSKACMLGLFCSLRKTSPVSCRSSAEHRGLQMWPELKTGRSLTHTHNTTPCSHTQCVDKLGKTKSNSLSRPGQSTTSDSPAVTSKEQGCCSADQELSEKNYSVHKSKEK